MTAVPLWKATGRGSLERRRREPIETIPSSALLEYACNASMRHSDTRGPRSNGPKPDRLIRGWRDTTEPTQ